MKQMLRINSILGRSLSVIFLFIWLVIPASAQLITTAVGSNSRGDGGPATNASLAYPISVAIDTSGNQYIVDSDNNRIRKVTTSGIITTVAGTGTPGFSGDGGPATAASLDNPNSVAVDSLGNLYIADFNNHRIRKVATSGVITTVAGSGTFGFGGDGGPATSAKLWYPRGVAVDGKGNLYIADFYNYRIRKVDTLGIITTVAGNGTFGFAGDGGPATSASLSYPYGVSTDHAGNLYLADRDNQRIRKVATSGIITTVAGNGSTGFSGDGGPATAASMSYPTDVVADSLGNLYIADPNNQRIRKVNTLGVITTVAGTGSPNFGGDGGPATAATMAYPSGVAIDKLGNLFIADQGNNRIRKVNTSAIISTVAGNGTLGFSGDGGPAPNADLYYPIDVVVDKAGNLFIADQGNNRIRKVATSGVITTVAGNGTFGFGGDGGLATSANLANPTGVVVDGSGNLFIADQKNHRIRKVTPAGSITTVAGNGILGFSGDGGLAINASLDNPSGVAVDASGNLFIIDTGNNRIRKVSPAGSITTVAGNGTAGFGGDGGPATAASLNNPSGIAIDTAKNLYIADRYNHRIRKVTASGSITTVAGNGFAGFTGDGGPALNARLNNPNDVSVDSSGTLYIADLLNNRIRRVTTSGIIRTVAGSSYGFAGDGGSALSAKLANPSGVATDSLGNVYIADLLNNRIRKVRGAIVSKQTGNWSNVTTWTCNCLPTVYDTVTISAGHTVTVNQIVRAHLLRQFGRLLFTAGGKVSF
ncbi:SMP-30/gluconolactonase/LRE family protein [Spirosoma sp. BT702]|uniref:SMP-30/gluconolactonase/LRE family protein n=1 Tax=Spirosoma profusum TaxID=2771354 RepID=A0A927ANZ3_9BACT|nr:NHL repeat-containing protein [Spirosoma profusum]MBD2702914.1 SMP-30/gluconolactonase/LRE family protein [Spirosoma profusum]